jgi:hypothetical protein
MVLFDVNLRLRFLDVSTYTLNQQNNNPQNIFLDFLDEPAESERRRSGVLSLLSFPLFFFFFFPFFSSYVLTHERARCLCCAHIRFW